jgi:DedD protein
MSDADVELARVTARRRMIGMALLVLAGVVGFPWLFETQPRPLTGDVQVLSANTTAPVVVPVPRTAVTGRVQTASSVEAEMVEAPEPSPSPDTAASSPSTSAKVAAAEAVVQASPTAAATAVAALAAVPAKAKPASEHASAPHVSDAASKAAAARVKAEAKAKADAKAKQDAKAHSEAKAKAEEKAHDDKLKAQAKAKADEKAHHEAKLKADEKAKGKDAGKDTAKAKPDVKPDPKADAKASGDTRYIVQVGAFSDTNTAQTARAKVEKLGIKTYTQEVNTPTGKKIRVRVGPYPNKAEADKAMASLKKAGLVAAVLTL